MLRFYYTTIIFLFFETQDCLLPSFQDPEALPYTIYINISPNFTSLHSSQANLLIPFFMSHRQVVLILS